MIEKDYGGNKVVRMQEELLSDESLKMVINGAIAAKAAAKGIETKEKEIENLKETFLEQENVDKLMGKQPADNFEGGEGNAIVGPFDGGASSSGGKQNPAKRRIVPTNMNVILENVLRGDRGAPVATNQTNEDLQQASEILKKTLPMVDVDKEPVDRMVGVDEEPTVPMEIDVVNKKGLEAFRKTLLEAKESNWGRETFAMVNKEIIENVVNRMNEN